jgi:hypothetical protein
MSPLLNQVLFTLGLVPLVLATTMSKNVSVGTNKLICGAFPAPHASKEQKVSL